MQHTDKILARSAHRPYPLPSHDWRYFQQWRDVLMVHIKVPVHVARQSLPAGLALDLFQGEAWMSVFAFKVHNNRLRHLPPVPYVSDFCEVNLRTYCIRDGKPGVYFLAIDADKTLAVWLARTLLGLPYEVASISRDGSMYALDNPGKRTASAVFRPSPEAMEKDKLDAWLTERYCVYSISAKAMYRHDIHHEPWPLHEASVSGMSLDYADPAYRLTANESSRFHYSQGLDVLIWPKVKAG